MNELIPPMVGDTTKHILDKNKELKFNLVDYYIYMRLVSGVLDICIRDMEEHIGGELKNKMDRFPIEKAFMLSSMLFKKGEDDE